LSGHIHPTAVIAEGAEIHPDADIGPYCVIDADVRIGAGCRLVSHVVIGGRTRIGSCNRIFPFASIGHEPQDLKYKGELSELVIGDNNTIRENVTINPGTEGGGMITRIGNDNLLMAYAHVAHDCMVGNGAVLANAATLAGHVEVGDGAIIGGLSAIHQFIRIGQHTMVGGMSGVVKDVPPYCLTAGGYRPGLAGLNLIGLTRRGVNAESIRILKEVYRILFKGSGALEARLEEVRSIAADNSYAREMVEFARTAKRGLTLHRRDAG
jgi:UDP-N-acetylglucosamine acyltransferase